jgi:uncharacterized membrane protein/predicted DsbA family dithiol-disulfide isomerase
MIAPPFGADRARGKGHESMPDRAERSAARLMAGVRVLSLAALAIASVSAVEYYGRAHAFCAPGSGCDVVRASALGRAIGMALPAIGLFGFAFVLIASLSEHSTLRGFAWVGALTGGVVGLGLLLAQALVIGTFCPICAGVDAIAVGAGICAAPLLRHPTATPSASPRAIALWRAACVLAVGLPAAWAFSRPDRVPSYVRTASKPGAINVIELSDFECPFCRAMHPALKAAMAPYADRVHFVRKTFPLPGHLHARDAARAYLCAEDQVRGEIMADWLFAAPDLSAATTEAHAQAFGLDLARFAACVHNPGTDRRIDDVVVAVKREGFEGLPLVFIGEHAFLGFDASAGARPYVDALARAANGEVARRRWAPWAMLVVALGVAMLLPAPRRRS